MMISFLITIAVLVQYADGNQKIVYVSKLTNGEGDSTCCMYGNCSCSSLDHALVNLTSNVLINITTDVTLSSLILVSNIENASIVGHNNPTIHCKRTGGMHFTCCHNCIIQGITWDGCGTEYTEPGLKLSNSSNISIKNCSFQYSTGQAVVLAETSGDVNISYCNFIHNNHYRGHGAAIHYSSSNIISCHHLSLSYCNFINNQNAQSLASVY